MNLAQMRERLRELTEANRAMLDAAMAASQLELSEEDDKKFKANESEIGRLRAAIERIENQDALEASLSESRGARAGGTTQPHRTPGAEAQREFSSFGEFLNAVRFNSNDQRLTTLFHEGDANRQVAMLGTYDGSAFHAEQRMDTGSAGGFMVPRQMLTEILRVDPLQSIVRPRARVIPAGTPPDAGISIPALDQSGATPANVFGGVQVDWIAEGQEKPETDFRLKEIGLEPHEVAAHIFLTDKLLRNWQAAGSFAEDLLRGAIRQSEDFAFIYGSGTGKPLGFLNANNKAMIQISRETAGDVTYDDIINMYVALLDRSGGANIVWMGSRLMMGTLMKIKDEMGRPIFILNAGTNLPPTLLGHPIIWSDRFRSGDLAIADLSAYLIKDGSGPFVATSEHVKFLENKTAIKIFWNVDGQPWQTEPFTEENDHEVSPFVMLGDPG